MANNETAADRISLRKCMVWLLKVYRTYFQYGRQRDAGPEIFLIYLSIARLASIEPDAVLSAFDQSRFYPRPPAVGFAALAEIRRCIAGRSGVLAVDEHQFLAGMVHEMHQAHRHHGLGQRVSSAMQHG